MAQVEKKKPTEEQKPVAREEDRRLDTIVPVKLPTSNEIAAQNQKFGKGEEKGKYANTYKITIASRSSGDVSVFKIKTNVEIKTESTSNAQLYIERAARKGEVFEKIGDKFVRVDNTDFIERFRGMSRDHNHDMVLVKQ